MTWASPLAAALLLAHSFDGGLDAFTPLVDVLETGGITCQVDDAIFMEEVLGVTEPRDFNKREA